MFIIDYCLDMFRASLCPSSGEMTTCYCIRGFLLVVLDVAGCGSVVLRCRVWALWRLLLELFIIDYCLDMFRASLCPSSGEKSTCYCIWGFLLVVLDVAGCGSVALRCRVWALWRLLLELQPSQCSHPTATFTVLTPYNVAPQNRNQPHPTLPANTFHMH